MVLIILNENNYYNRPFEIVKWLIFYDNEFVKIDKIYSIKIHSGTVLFVNDNICLDDVSNIWINDPHFEVLNGLGELPSSIDNIPEEIKEELSYVIKSEKKFLQQFFFNTIKSMFGNALIFRKVNKLKVLRLAESLGLKVPLSFISQDSNIINSEYSNCITKPLSNVFTYNSDTTFVTTSTVLAREFSPKKDIFPTFLEERIKAKYELKVVCIGKEQYAVAVFSSNKKSTVYSDRSGSSSLLVK